MQLLYGPKGRAGEYGELAANLRLRCPHGCLYCYAPGVLRISREKFHKEAAPRDRGVILRKFEADCRTLAKQGNTKPIFLSFLDDPIQVGEDNTITVEAVKIAHAHGQRVNILTKAGWGHAEEIIRLLGRGDIFGITLTTADAHEWNHWEPWTAAPDRRIEALEKAYSLGLQTRVSFEPVLDPGETLSLIRRVHPFTNLIQVGKLNAPSNAAPEVKEREKAINWGAFALTVAFLLSKLRDGRGCLIKRDLERYLPEAMR